MAERKIRNILFIMYDQLRFDYLSCAGHPWLETPNMDWLAANGVRFTRCYTQSPICGPARMSFYTGRYVHSHGASCNNFPLKVGEQTLGDHLRPLGMQSWLVGKTHMAVDAEGMARLGLAADSVIGARVGECGFDVFVRDDGIWSQGPEGVYDNRTSPYNAYLKQRGYDAEIPWHDYANSGITDDGDLASGWFMKNAALPANIKAEDSETAWLTSRMIDFLDERQGAEPWLCHLSYIKPHWPYIVPAPYHAMYGRNQMLPVRRHPAERENPHPIYKAFMEGGVGRAFSRDEVIETVVPAYMGLIKQCDDELGRLLEHLRQTGGIDDTLIVLTADHGDYLGDHWLGEKDLFHDPSVKIPLIVFDPTAAADSTRGETCDELVEAIDLAATFIEAAGGTSPGHIVEGRSLMPFIRGERMAEWREFAVSEYDYSTSPVTVELGLKLHDARLVMIADKHWKFVHDEGGARPMLFDLDADRDEFFDLGESGEHAAIIAMMYERLSRWARRISQRTTIGDLEIEAGRGSSMRKGVLIGVHDEADLDEGLTAHYRGKARQRHTGGKPGKGRH